MTQLSVSVIIVTWKSREAVTKCLESLAALDEVHSLLETIVVDNRSNDGTSQVLLKAKESFPNIRLRLILNERNIGLSEATEQAYKIATGEWILLCNPDIVFTNDFIRMVSFAKSQDEYSLLAAEMVNLDGSLQRMVIRRFPTVARVFFSFSALGYHLDRFLLRNYFRDHCAYSRIRFKDPVSPVDQPGASFLLLSRDAVRRVGGIFSPEFPIWWNDVDLAKRAQKAGIKRGVMPSIRISHEQGGSAKMLPQPHRRYLFCLSMIRYCKKWKMHPRLVQTLFFLDGLFNAAVGWPLWILQLGPNTGVRQALAYSKSQIRGILTA